MLIFEERRVFPRYPGGGLAAEVDGVAMDVFDICFEGVRLIAGHFTPGQKVRLRLLSKDGGDGVVAVDGEVVVVAEGYTHIRFKRVQYALARTIVATAARALGVLPREVK
ncbi:MAG: hypothetical protein ACM3Q1_13335 [Bacteroidales bacterium]